jgi:hypothetical protein
MKTLTWKRASLETSNEFFIIHGGTLLRTSGVKLHPARFAMSQHDDHGRDVGNQTAHLELAMHSRWRTMAPQKVG